MKLPKSFINDVLSRIDIVDIIQSRVSLTKRGQAKYAGLCPFHQEKTPSFTVSQAKQLYHCFGCKAGGDVIDFLTAYEKLSFVEAVEALASKAGLNLPQTSVPSDDKKPHFSLLEKVASFYQSQLEENTEAKNYLRQRGLSPDIITQFKLGFAPPGWNNLKKLLDKTASEKMLLEVGLAKTNTRGTFDHFRQRIIFPIHNRKGQIIAFGGRSLGAITPKYLNSPETPLFHKGRELYGLYQSLQARQQLTRMIIVEGYLDVIALHQQGLTETVATLGTAITASHIQTLLRYCHLLIFCFDGDLAGQKAAWRTVEIALPFLHMGIDIRFICLPKDEDPDSFVRKVGVQAFNEALNKAVSLIDFFFNKLESEENTSSLPGKIRLVKRVHQYLENLPKGIFQELIYQRLSSAVDLSTEKIQDILNPTSIKPKEPAIPLGLNFISPLRIALCLLIQAPLLLQEAKIPPDFDILEIKGIDLLKKIIDVIQKNTPKTTGILLTHFDPEEKNVLLDLAAQDLLLPASGWAQELQGSLDRLVAINLEKRIKEILTKARDQGLTEDEKKLLQNLLISEKQL